MGSKKRGAAKRRNRRPADRGDLQNGPAFNSIGEWQTGTRSSAADRERLAHIPVTVFDLEGVAAHVAGIEATPRTFVRPTSAADQRAGASGNGAGERAPGWGAPHELLDNPCVHIAAAERRIDRDHANGPRMIATPHTRRDAACNALATMTPLRRLTWLRRITTVADAPATPASA